MLQSCQPKPLQLTLGASWHTPAPVCEAGAGMRRWGKLLTHGASWPLPGQRPLPLEAPASPSGFSDPNDAILLSGPSFQHP